MLRSWLDKALPQAPPTSATGKALNTCTMNGTR